MVTWAVCRCFTRTLKLCTRSVSLSSSKDFPSRLHRSPIHNMGKTKPADATRAITTSTSPPPEPITIDGRQYRPVREGLASVLAPYKEGSATNQKGHNNDEGKQAVFYNPIQQFNRDLTVLAILNYGEGALVEKRALWSKKSKNRHAKKAKQNGLTNGRDASENSKKRKSDDDFETDRSKRARTEDAEMGDIEVAELHPGESEPPKEVLEQPTEKQSNTAKERQLAFTILDALSATGLRALRYAKEIPFATNIIANDLSRDAVKSIELNITHNEVNDKVHSNVGDARAYMYSKIGNEHAQPSEKYVHRFDVVDLDPYGTAAPFIDAALQCLQDGGLLCVTCTDAGVFASVGYLEKTFALYQGLPVKGAHCHEAGLRLIIHSIATTASKYGIAIEPLLSLSIDFYARVFIRIHKRPNEVKLLAGTTMVTYTCDQGCGAWTTQTLSRNVAKEDRAGNTIYKHSFSQAPSISPYCEHCGLKMHLGGPMWAGPLHNPHFVQRMLDRIPSLDPKTYGTLDRLRGMLTLALEEDLSLDPTAATTSPTDPPDTPPSDTNLTTSTPPPSSQPTTPIPRTPPHALDPSPFYFLPNYLAKTISAQTPSESILRGALHHLGWRVSRSHCRAGSIKTDAPWPVLWGVMREFVRQKSPIKEGSLREGGPGARIMAEGKDRVGEVRGEVERGMGKASDKEQTVAVLKAALWKLENQGGGGNEGRGEMVLKRDGTRGEVVFDEALGKEKPRGKLVRYQINPRENWGPMNRAGGS